MSEAELEALKHRNATELEKLKWQFKKEELSFLEAGQHLRSLNQQLWQVPGMVIAVTGGIWYGVASISGDQAKILALCFAAGVNILTTRVIWRLRSIIEIQINLQNKFNKIQRRTGKNTVVLCWTVLLSSAAFLSFLGAVNIENVGNTKTAAQPPTTNNYLYPQNIEIIKR